jgi:hypothetical protein
MFSKLKWILSWSKVLFQCIDLILLTIENLSLEKIVKFNLSKKKISILLEYLHFCLFQGSKSDCMIKLFSTDGKVTIYLYKLYFNLTFRIRNC